MQRKITLGNSKINGQESEKEEKKPEKYILLDRDGEMVASSDDREWLVGFRNKMLASRHFAKGKVRAMIITENKIR